MAAEAKAPLLEEARRGATPAQTIGNIVVSIVGTGVLGLPFAFRTAGWLAGALGVAGAGAATFYCMLLLLECRDKLREQETEEDGEQHQRCCNYTYGDLGERCFGRIGRHFTEATIILSQTGGTVAYLVFIGQNVSSVFAAEDGHGPLTPATVVLALLLPVQAALSLVRSLSSLGQFSILADACTVLAVATVVKQDLQLLAARGEQPFQGRAAVEGLWGVAFAAGFAVFCFEGFCMTLALEASMADRSRFRSVLLQAIAGVTAVYVCFGACGYLAYGDATKDIITLNLPTTWSTAAVKCAGCAVHRAGTDVPGDDAPDPRDRGGAAAGAGRVAAEARRRRGECGPAREPRRGAGGAVGDRVLRAGVRVVRVLRGEHGVRAALLRAARAVPPPRRGPRRGRRAARRRLGHPPLRPRLRGARPVRRRPVAELTAGGGRRRQPSARSHSDARFSLPRAFVLIR